MTNSADSKIPYTNDTEEKWVNVEDVADHLGISLDTARTWTKNGKLPAFKVGKRYKYKLSEIDAWVRAEMMADLSQTGEDTYGRI